MVKTQRKSLLSFKKKGALILSSLYKNCRAFIYVLYKAWGSFWQSRPKSLRQKILKVSFVVCVVLPSLVGSMYYAFLASDRYVDGAGFTVRGMGGPSKIDVVGAFTGMASSGSTTSDSYIILKYLKSRDLLQQLQKDFDFRAAYSDQSIDFISRLNPELSIEGIVEYWEGVLKTTFDPTSGIITFNVEAFRAQDAHKISKLILKYVKNLVNHLSQKARADSVHYAEVEVKRSEMRLRQARKNLLKFREKEKSIDPTRSAQVQIELLGSLEKQLLDVKARMSALEGNVESDSPSLRSLRRKAEALEKQITGKGYEICTRDGAIKSGKPALSALLASYEGLEIDKKFAQEAYALALSSLENARMEADRQQRYLAVFRSPALPESSLYPRRVLSSCLLFLILSCIWAIGTLIAYSVRDHLS